MIKIYARGNRDTNLNIKHFFEQEMQCKNPDKLSYVVQHAYYYISPKDDITVCMADEDSDLGLIIKECFTEYKMIK